MIVVSSVYIFNVKHNQNALHGTYAVQSKIKLNKQTYNENNAINHWTKLLNIEWEIGGWVKVNIKERVKFKLPDVVKPWLFV